MDYFDSCPNNDDDDDGGSLTTGNGDYLVTHLEMKTVSTNCGRRISFSTCGDPAGKPVIFFYPAGGNRRMLEAFHEIAHAQSSLRLICVNRPGMGYTDVTESRGEDPAAHTEAVCSDIESVLGSLSLHIEDVAGLLFECAGAPFALAFATKFSDRLAEDVLVMGIAPWVLPGDCKSTKSMFQFGAVHCPLWLSSALAGSVMGSVNSSIRFLPGEMKVNALKRKFSDEEKQRFERQYTPKGFVAMMDWMNEEKGCSLHADLKVLLSTGAEVGIDYERIRGNKIIFHGENDTLIPIEGAKWLVQKLNPAELCTLKEGCHEASLFLLHPEPIATLKEFGNA